MGDEGGEIPFEWEEVVLGHLLCLIHHSLQEKKLLAPTAVFQTASGITPLHSLQQF